MKICPLCNLAYLPDVEECPTDHTPVKEAEAWHEGEVIGGEYQILAKISEDMACTVYKAIQLKRKQVCVLEAMNKHLASNPDFIKLFKRGAARLMKIRHASVARVESIEKTPYGLPFLVMECPEGRTLRETIQHDSPLAPLRACAIAKQIAAGLEAGHSQGIIHRDLNPDRVLVLGGRGKDKIKLLGFGNSQFKEAIVGDHFRTSPDTIIGTFEYLSPEQALGRSGKQVDGRSDLYSLGVILYQMLTRELPFRANRASEFLIAHIQGTPIPIRVAHGDLGIPDILNAMVLHCLQKDPSERPSTAREFISDIEYVEREIKKGRGTLSSPSGLRLSGWKFWES